MFMSKQSLSPVAPASCRLSRCQRDAGATDLLLTLVLFFVAPPLAAQPFAPVPTPTPAPERSPESPVPTPTATPEPEAQAAAPANPARDNNQGWTVTPVYDTNVWCTLRGYDLEGGKGIGWMNPTPAGARTRLTFDDYSGAGDSCSCISLSTLAPEYVPYGASFRFWHYVPYYGHVAGRNIAEVAETVWFIIPVNGTEAEMRGMETDEYSYGAAVTLGAVIMDTLTSASIGIPHDSNYRFPTAVRDSGANLWIDYLPGNALEEQVGAGWRFEPGDFSDILPAARWGPGTGGYTSLAELGEEITIGPIRVSFSIDG